MEVDSKEDAVAPECPRCGSPSKLKTVVKTTLGEVRFYECAKFSCANIFSQKVED